MIWSHAIHLFAGVLGEDIMTWSVPGVIASLVVASVTQAINTIRLHFYFRRRYLAEPEHIQQRYPRSAPDSLLYWRKVAEFYVWKVIWYGFVTLAAAHIMRSWYAGG